MPNRVRVRRDMGQRSRNRLAQKRKKRRIILAVVLGVVVLLMVGGFFYAVRLPQFSIQTIQVEGTYEVSPDALRASVALGLADSGFALIPRRMIFTYPKAAIETKLLQEFPELQSATLSRDSLLGTVLTLRVVERTLYGIWCSSGDALVQTSVLDMAATSTEMSTQSIECYEMDASGFIFAPADGFAEFYIFYGGVATSVPPITQYFYPGRMDSLRTLLGALSPIGFDPHIVRVVDESDVDIELLGGMYIKVSLNITPEETISALATVLSSDALKDKQGEIEYIDVRFGNRVYYKFQRGAQ